MTRLHVQGVYIDLRLAFQLPAHVSTASLMDRWACSQPTVSRRLQSLQRAGLATVRRSGPRGHYWIEPVRFPQLRALEAVA
jgi:DNA-binding IclR family transcriptional regulator